MLVSYRPCMADESEANVAGKLDTSVLHYIEARLVQMNSSLHGSFKFNKFYQRHELALTKIKGTHECLGN